MLILSILLVVAFDPGLATAAAQPAPEGASERELLSREVLRRMSGGQAKSDPKLIAYLGTPEGRSDVQGLNLDILTAEERKAITPEPPPDIPKPDEKNLPPAAFEVPSP